MIKSIIQGLLHKCIIQFLLHKRIIQFFTIKKDTISRKNENWMSKKYVQKRSIIRLCSKSCIIHLCSKSRIICLCYNMSWFLESVEMYIILLYRVWIRYNKNYQTLVVYKNIIKSRFAQLYNIFIHHSSLIIFIIPNSNPV